MQFEKNAADLDCLIHEALALPEFQSDLTLHDDQERARLQSLVRANSDAIWDVANKEIEQYDAIAADMDSRKHQLANERHAREWVIRVLLRASWILLTGGAAIVIAFAGRFWLATGRFAPRTAHDFANQPDFLLIGILLSVAAMLFVASASWALKAFRRRFNASRVLPVLQEAEANLANARTRVLARVSELGVLRILRTTINNYLKPSYRTDLDLLSSARWELGTAAPSLVKTSAHQRLHFMLTHFQGASIGLAGPRGAGKSTLIQAFCRKSQAQFDGKQTLPIYTSAPVNYQSRDFLLHLFASACHSVLENLSPLYIPEVEPWPTLHVNAPVTAGGRRLKRVLHIALVLGLLLLLTGTIFAISTFHQPPQTKDATHSARASISGATTLRFTIQNASAPQPFSVQVPITVDPQSGGERKLTADALPLGAAARFASIVGITPYLLFWSGFLLTLSSLIIISLVGGLDFWRTGHPTTDTLKDSALRWLTNIKFQQTFSGGWSGSIKLASSVEAGLSQAKSMALQQLTMPEIVSGFIQFIRQACIKYTVIIGIDELDKIETDRKALAFLNDVKSVFGIPGAFFLIAVSESAMSSFERRGLLFRDAFDSAFDDLVFVDYMTFKSAGRVLAERVIGMPVQFQALCYCLSGGLARELVRVCRDLIEQARRSGDTDLSSLCSHLVAADIRAKLRSAAHAVQRPKCKPYSRALLTRIARLDHELPLTPATLLKHAKEVNEHFVEGRPHLGEGETTSAAQILTSVADEIDAYLRFMAAILTFFTNSLDKQQCDAAQASGWFERLASALQNLYTNPSLSRELIAASAEYTGALP